jgi:hypothetical protein
MPKRKNASKKAREYEEKVKMSRKTLKTENLMVISLTEKNASGSSERIRAGPELGRYHTANHKQTLPGSIR